MKRILSIGFILLLLTLFILPTLPISAADPVAPIKEKLGTDETRLTSSLTTKLVSSTPAQISIKDKTGKAILVNGSIQTYQATISSLPQTLQDLSTKIQINWIDKTSKDGIKAYETDGNIYWSRVTGTRVTLQYNNKEANWDPDILLGSTQMQLQSGPNLIDDPYNKNYNKNIVQWVYSLTTGNILSKKSVTVTRYLRQIEGLLQEWYLVGSDPGDTLTINPSYVGEIGSKAPDNIYAYDSGIGLSRKSIVIIGSITGKSVSKFEFSRKDITYPIIIDPSTSFTSASYDGSVMYIGAAAYATAQVASSANSIDSTTALAYVGQSYASSLYNIARSALYFDTSGLPDTAVISAGSIVLNVPISQDGSNTDFNIQIQSGMPTYPSIPLSTGDYNRSLYSSNGGAYNTAYGVSSSTIVPLNSTGLTWINTTSWTKFILRSDREIGSITPTGYESIGFWTYEAGIGYQPQLNLTYTVPVSAPTITTTSPATGITGYSATVGGTVTNDGGAAASVNFNYGTTGSYGQTTPWLSNYTTGMGWTQTISSLNYGTLYHYTAVAQNSGGTSVTSDATFLSLPNTPTVFTVTPGNTQNVLGWTIGTGSTKTMVRRSTTGFPATVADGTQVYFDTSNTVTDTGLTNGTTYYYSAFGYISSGSLVQYSSSAATGSGIPLTTGPPAVNTYPATLVTATGATLNGNLASLQGAASADVSFQYGLNTGYGSTTTPETLTAVGNITPVGTSGLSVSTVYHFRAKAVSTNGTSYGADQQFTTGGPSSPVITSNDAQGVGQTGGTLYGTVTDSGNAIVTSWFQWGANTSYGHTTGTTTGLNTGDQFYIVLSGTDGLIPNTTYHFRAAGQNTTGISYGTDKSFTTSIASLPTVITNEVSGLGATSVTLNGYLQSNGGENPSVRFRISSTGIFGGEETNTAWVPGKTTGDNFTYFANGLTVGVTYYFQTQAQNSGGTSTGATKTFLTDLSAPSTLIATPQSTTSISLKWTQSGDKVMIRVKEGAFPADRQDGDQVYFGSATSFTHSPLQSGVTYFYRAWAWQTGDIYSTTYAEDACTTSGIAGTSSTSAIPDFSKPTAPSWWFGPTNFDKVMGLPLLPYIKTIGMGMGWTESATATITWAVILTIVVVCCIPMGGLIALGALMFLSFIFGQMGLMPGVIMVVFLCVGGFGLWFFSQSGGGK